ncbi:MAG: hypothetical protein RRA15_08520 [bacterium]|nr:hypothetical protein [bacterium]MDT8366524.1 hypothetical protein [bacterium]
MKKIVVVAAMLLGMVMVASGPMAAYAEDLSAEQVKALESVGVQVYPGASYTTGDNEVATIMWFKSKDSPDKIMDWYEEKFSDWSEMDVTGAGSSTRAPGVWRPRTFQQSRASLLGPRMRPRVQQIPRSPSGYPNNAKC